MRKAEWGRHQLKFLKPSAEEYVAIEVSNLTKRFDDTYAVSNLTFKVNSGDLFGLLGPNGAGKTSSINMMSSMMRPSSGEVKLFGKNVGAEPLETRKIIGLVFQDSSLDRQLSVWENLRFAGLLHNLPMSLISDSADQLLKLFNLQDKRNKPVVTLSGGQRRALDIARGVIHKPKILFLDEPTIGLDLPTRLKLWEFIHDLRVSNGMTVLLTTHYLEEASGCNEVAFLKEGKLVLSGQPEELRNKLCSSVLEIESPIMNQIFDKLTSQFGRGKQKFRTAYINISENENLNLSFRIDQLKKQFGNSLTKLIVRPPNLNDVFLWINQ